MALIACPVPGKAKSKMLCDAFIEGAPAHAQGFVFYGVKAGNHREWVEARRSGLDWYFIDNSYFDQTRGTMFRVCKNRLQHSGLGDSDGQRLAAIPGLRIGGAAKPDGHVLVVEQSLDHYKFVVELKDPEHWLQRTLRKEAGARPIKVRTWNADKNAQAEPFARDLAGACRLVTHTSAAAVMAVLAGVPVSVDPMSAAALATAQAGFGERLRWGGVLADNQWTIDEMKEGAAWRKLNPT